jgi:hypothetical protein
VSARSEAIALSADDALCCPCCEEEGGLHQDCIEIFNRSGEDAPSTRIVVPNRAAAGDPAGGIEISGDAEQNPSSRRQGARIRFWCEFCDLASSGWVLAISQHKGATLIHWVRP